MKKDVGKSMDLILPRHPINHKLPSDPSEEILRIQPIFRFEKVKLYGFTETSENLHSFIASRSFTAEQAIIEIIAIMIKYFVIFISQV